MSFRKLATPVKFVKIELIKVEWSQQESMDTAIWTNVLFPPKAKLSESGWLKNKVVRLEPDEDGDIGATARSQADAPEIDGQVYLRNVPAALAPGAVIDVEIEDSDAHDLFGVPV